MQRFRAWWDRRSRWAKIGLIVLAAVFGLTFLGAALPSDDDEATSDATTTTVAEPQPQPETKTEEEPDPEQIPPPPTEADTGRMSDGEFDQFSRAVDEVDEEVAEFGNSLPRCGVLFQAVELAAASDCIDEADNGVEEDITGAYATTEDLQSDVGKACLRNLRAYKRRLDAFYGWFQQVTGTGKNLQFAEFTRLARRSGVQARRYQRAKRAALASCTPA